MRHYKVNKITHVVFENTEEVPEDISYLREWRDGRLHDWVLSDDGCVIQILREGKMVKPKGKVREARYIGTCTGTFFVSKKTKMDTSRRNNIYTFSGNGDFNEQTESRENLTSREEMFVNYCARGMDPRQAYLQAFPTDNPHYAGIRAGQLIKTTRIRTAMKEELKPVMEELNLNETYVLENMKNIIDTSQKDDTRLKALFKLADIMDMEDKNKTQVTQITGAMFQGFSDEKLKQAERPKEITDGVR
tara:strand:+ start:428 stop:1168 length:741 start_codon:yes stop_codon:yes gene_type:complete